MANVKRHGSKYQARVRKLDPSGLVVDKSKSFSLKKDAEKWAREMERSIENGTHKNTSERHWSLFIDPYLEYYEQSSDKVRPRDVKVRRTHLKEFWLPLIGDKYISSIDEQDLRDGQAEADNGERENSTVNKYVFSMQNFLQCKRQRIDPLAL